MMLITFRYPHIMFVPNMTSPIDRRRYVMCFRVTLIYTATALFTRCYASHRAHPICGAHQFNCRVKCPFEYVQWVLFICIDIYFALYSVCGSHLPKRTILQGDIRNALLHYRTFDNMSPQGIARHYATKRVLLSHHRIMYHGYAIFILYIHILII